MEEKKKSKKPIIALVIIAVVGVVAYLIFGGSGVESTDNAQIDGDILSVRSSVTAYVEEIRFEDNQQVKMGDTLIIFETSELRAKVAQAEAALHNAEAALASASNRANAGVENVQAAILNAKALEASLAAAKANLTRTQQSYDRTLHLFEIKAATQEQKESAEAALAIAKADYARIQDQQRASESSSTGLSSLSASDKDAIQLAAASVEQRRAELDLAKEQLSHAYVTSPFNGIVTKRSIQNGQFVTAGQSLCTVVQLDELWVTANFKETQIENIKPGQEVEVEIDALPGKALHGKVASFSGATGAKFALLPPDNATGNFVKVTQRFPIRIDLDLSNENDRAMLYPGLSVIVKVKVK